MSKDVIRQLKSLKIGEANPRPEWLKNNRELLLRQIKNTVRPVEVNSSTLFNNIWSSLSLFVPRTVVYNFVRPIAVLLVVAIVGTSGWIATVDAAYEALPGDVLYSAKRAMEKTQLAVASLTGDQTKETKLHVEFAKRRATEIKKVAKSSDPGKLEKVVQTVNDLKSEIKSVNQSLDQSQAGTPGDLSANQVKDLKVTTESINTVLQAVKADMVGVTSTPDQMIVKEVTEANDMVKDTGVKAVEVIVDKHLQGDKSVSTEDVKQEITNTLNNTIDNVAVVKVSVDGVKQVVDAVKGEVKEVVNETKGSSSTTIDVTKQITDVSNEANSAVVKTNAVSLDIGKKVDEAKEMLTVGNLTDAVNKIKEVNTAGKEAEKISDATINKVQTVLPVVDVIKNGLLSATGTKDIVVVVTTTPVITPTATIVIPTVKVIVTTTPEKK